ncbi:MAG: alkaline phosphatase [Ruminococcaceae bacterium]|nr:alkaline phosphatase [Oscillospiraceae bacterium]
MEQKIVLVLVDGMRPDGLIGCGNPYVEKLLAESAYTLSARTVMPSCTLPCHMSLFHSVEPGRHGITSNLYTPQVRPVKGLCNKLDNAGKKCAFFITWEELRDLSRPDELHYSLLINQHKRRDTDTAITNAAIDYILAEEPDFTFIYLGETDEVGGHDVGWMSETYMGSVNKAISCTQTLIEALPENYTVILTADHGGHDRSHGTEMPEDMTIPVVIRGKGYTGGRNLGEGVSIMDIAPTITHLLGVAPDREWVGKILEPEL